MKILNIGRWLLFIILPFSATAQVKDTLFFNNGDVLIGEVKSISLGRIKFDDDNMDVLSVKGTQIRKLKAAAHIYRFESLDGKLYYTSLDTGPKGYVRLKESGVTRQVRLVDINKLTPLEGKTG